MAETIKATQQPDGVAVEIADGNGGHTRYGFQGDQFDKFCRNVSDAAHPLKSMKPGDLSAARDMANESKKQIES